MKSKLLIGGILTVATYIAVHQVVDADLQNEITNKCKINGGWLTRSLDRDTTSASTRFLFFDNHVVGLRFTQIGYYWLNLKLAQLLHSQHHITMDIDFRQSIIFRPTVRFNVSEAQYHQ